MHYELYRDYRTGDSFGSETRFESFGFVWTDLELAKEAFMSVTEHYCYYKEQDSRSQYSYVNNLVRKLGRHSYREQDKITDFFIANRLWYKNSECRYSGEHVTSWMYSGGIGVRTEVDEWRTLDVGSHTGYFESLYTILLIEVNDSENYECEDDIPGDMVICHKRM